MTALQNPDSSYFIISASRLDEVSSILYAKDFQIILIQGFYKGEFEDSILAFKFTDNDELRRDVLFLLNQFDEECAIVKYQGEPNAKKVFRDGSEIPLGIVMYNTDAENVSYLHNGLSFSFVESKRYWKPKRKEDFRVGMLVEYFNNNKWCERKVLNPQDEYEKLYKLLIKYDKVRVASN